MKKKDLLILILTVILFAGIFIFSSNDKKDLDNNQILVPEEYTNKENNEAKIAEDYVRNNIKTIATNSPVLGGSWYVISLTIDPSMDSGTVVYEDGHIQSAASFSYEYNNGQILRIGEFNVIE